MSDISSCSCMPLFPLFPLFLILNSNQGLRRSRYAHSAYNRIPKIHPSSHSPFWSIVSSMNIYPFFAFVASIDQPT